MTAPPAPLPEPRRRFGAASPTAADHVVTFTADATARVAADPSLVRGAVPVPGTSGRLVVSAASCRREGPEYVFRDDAGEVVVRIAVSVVSGIVRDQDLAG